MSDGLRCERLLALTRRLTAAIEADIAALERRAPRELASIDPEFAHAGMLYAREVSALRSATAKPAEGPVSELRQATEVFHERLAFHQRLLNRLRGANEGLIRAVAEEVERRRNALRPYDATKPAPRAGASAVLYNSLA